MSDKRARIVTIQTKELYVEYRKSDSQKVAAARAGISKGTAYKIDKGLHRSTRKPREGKPTRRDPFVNVWDSYLVPLLEKGVSNTTLLYKELQKKHPEEYLDKRNLRTLQRKVSVWKALNGVEKEVIFRQEKPAPGKKAIADFTMLKDEITINGKLFKHKLFHLRLPHSGFTYIQAFEGIGESFAIFSVGVQNGYHTFGGSTEELRTDSLSAAFKNLKKDARNDLTKRYRSLLAHYGVQGTRNNRGRAHENGAIESPHGHIKDRLKHALVMRESNDFTSIADYQQFITSVVGDYNREHEAAINIERKALKGLPSSRGVDYEEAIAVVAQTSTVNIKSVTYSLPSRLIGKTLTVKLHATELAFFLGTHKVITLKRIYPEKGKQGYLIDYRHFIDSLRKKPRAFKGSVLRTYILPNDGYRDLWEYIEQQLDDREACKLMVELLALAKNHNCQKELSDEVIQLISQKKAINLAELQDKFNKNRPPKPLLLVKQHTLSEYTALMIKETQHA